MIVSGIPVRKNKTTNNLQKEFEKQVIRDLVITSEEYDFEYDKIHRVGKINGNEQNITVCVSAHINLKEKHKEKSVYQIENMDKFIELMIDMTSSNKNRSRQ